MDLPRWPGASLSDNRGITRICNDTSGHVSHGGEHCTRLVGIGAIALELLVGLCGCEREARRFGAAPRPPDARAQADSLSQQQAGPPGPGMREAAAAGGYAEDNAYTLAQGRLYYRWFNCVGCHAQGGGGIGPALMDASWIYGKEPGDVFTTIMDGRPNGMPSFRGRLPEQQAWQLVAYVRSLSGLVSSDAATNRGDTLAGGQPEYLREPLPPEDKKR